MIRTLEERQRPQVEKGSECEWRGREARMRGRGKIRKWRRMKVRYWSMVVCVEVHGYDRAKEGERQREEMRRNSRTKMTWETKRGDKVGGMSV